MIKTDLIDRVAIRTNLTRKQTTIVVNSFLSSITDSLVAGDEVEIRGFGSFRIRKRNARIGLNPKTGNKVHIPAKKAPYFRAGKNLKLEVNRKFETESNNKIFSLQDLTQIA
jgi:integration host factor subunit beta